ncbi:MAG: hypothetical protein JST79_19430 [Acidobacteria bacterium]|nr:hypothetical protein [Acidobacteriota bacterium]
MVGQRAALFGNETGRMEAWVYPLKIVRNLHFNFLVGGNVIPAESLARTLTVRPESAEILYAGNTFSVRETLFVPQQESGAVIFFDVETTEPLEIEAAFERDFQLEWPAALGGSYMSWFPPQRAFYFGEEQKKYVAFVGSPSAEFEHEEYFINSAFARENAFRLGPTAKGRDRKVVVLAASVEGHAEAEKTYKHLTENYAALLQQSAQYYRDYLAQTLNLELPDEALQKAYDWSRISTVQGLVTNPTLGTGLIAGYRSAGDSQRPGFAWYFGRDSFWTEQALNAIGDTATTRTALDFISKFQREDGKIPHEISQTAHLVDWFKNYPYGYASADATPLYLIAMNDYVTHSGDVAFLREKWVSVWKAYQFLLSTYDAGIPKNFGIGHGWVEGGPLLPVKSEFYQVGLGAEALRALANLARLTGKDDRQLTDDFAKQQTILNNLFWSPDKKYFAFALDNQNQRVNIASVLATVPMWFHLLDEAKAQSTIDELSAPGHASDWGMRILSNSNTLYGPGGYHFGSVWPLFTGWASVGEYRYHRSLPAYLNLRANSLLALDGSLGHVTEVLSGNNYETLSTGSPHQIWSAAMVVSPMVRGMLGLETDGLAHTVSFTPHVPADWTSFGVRNLHVGGVTLNLSYRKTAEGITLEVQRSGSGDCTLKFSPAFSPHAQLLGVTLNGKKATFQTQSSAVDQHAVLSIPLSASVTTIQLRTRGDFGLALAPALPALGAESSGLRFVTESWNTAKDTLQLEVAGRAGQTYELHTWQGAQIASVEGGELARNPQGEIVIRIPFRAADPASYIQQKLTLHFSRKSLSPKHP